MKREKTIAKTNLERGMTAFAINPYHLSSPSHWGSLIAKWYLLIWFVDWENVTVEIQMNSTYWNIHDQGFYRKMTRWRKRTHLFSHLEISERASHATWMRIQSINLNRVWRLNESVFLADKCTKVYHNLHCKYPKFSLPLYRQMRKAFK